MKKFGLITGDASDLTKTAAVLVPDTHENVEYGSRVAPDTALILAA